MSAAYCTIADLSLAIRSEALDGFDQAVLQDCIDGAADKIDGYLRDRFTLPLTKWDKAIRRCCAILAVYDAVIARGLNPANAAGDEQLQIRHDTEIGWLRDIANNRTTPDVIDSSPQGAEAVSSARAEVDSNVQRGYQRGTGDSYERIAFQGRRRS